VSPHLLCSRPKPIAPGKLRSNLETAGAEGERVDGADAGGADGRGIVSDTPVKCVCGAVGRRRQSVPKRTGFVLRQDRHRHRRYLR